MNPMMVCGHAANATSGGKPCCAICSCHIVATQPPNLEGRKAKCSYGDHAVVNSSTELAFFEHRPNQEKDIYYCGCYGYD